MLLLTVLVFNPLLLLLLLVFLAACTPVRATATAAAPPLLLVGRQSSNIQRCPLLFRTHPPNDASLPLPSQSPTPSPVIPFTPPTFTPTSSSSQSESDSDTLLPTLSPPPVPFNPPSSSSSRVARRDVVVTPRVVGGASVSSELRPYIAVLRFTIDGKTGVCSATLVSPTLLITAAHCVRVQDRRDLRIYLAASRGNPPNGAFRTASSIQAHPSFNNDNADTAQYDIAYIRLSSPAPASSLFMRVNTNRSIPLLGSVVRNIGYGLFDPEDLDSNARFVPHQVDLPVTGGNYCRRQWFPYRISINRRRQVCAGYLKGGCGSCNGDSGGPIFQYDDVDRPVLVGVASIAVQCSTTDVPTVYVRTSAFIGSFIPDDGVTLTNNTVAYVLPVANRTYPNGLGPASLSQGFLQFNTSTWVLIGVGVFAILLVLSAFVKWGPIKRRSPSQPSSHGQQQPRSLEQPQHPVHLGPVLVPLQPLQLDPTVPPAHSGSRFVAPDQIGTAPTTPPPPVVLAPNERSDETAQAQSPSGAAETVVANTDMGTNSTRNEGQR